MEASKITIDPINLQSPLLTHWKKAKLRKKAILDYMHETKRPVSSSEVRKLGYFPKGNADRFMQTVIKDKVVQQINPKRTPGNKYIYTLADKLEHEVKPIAETIAPPQDKIEKTTELQSIESHAMRYSWEKENANITLILKDFIAWIKERES